VYLTGITVLPFYGYDAVFVLLGTLVMIGREMIQLLASYREKSSASDYFSYWNLLDWG
jgi:hypothetical protein